MTLPLSVRLRVALQRWQRRRIRRKYGALFDEVAAILFRYDPVGISHEDNTDEYEPEVGTVLLRLQECGSSADVRLLLHQEFSRWFDPGTAGPEERYDAAARDVWDAWQRYKVRQDA